MARRPATVYCDFDGTITLCDVTDFILENLADPEWKEIEERWVNGEIGSRECMAQQVALIRGGWTAIEKILGEVKIDPTFAPFVKWCHDNKLPVVVASEGLDRVIYSLFQRESITVSRICADQLIEEDNGSLRLDFPYYPLARDCGAGLCKCRAFGEGLRIVVGDGRNDSCWAQRADLVFAKSKLLDFCRNNLVDCIPFTDFSAVREVLEQVLESASSNEKSRASELPCTIIS